MKRILIVVLACSAGVVPLSAKENPAVDFVKQVKPVLEDRCVECHNSETLLGDLNLETRAKAFRRRKGGPVIVPGEPEKSMLYLALKLPPKDPKAMPATSHRIHEDEVSILRQWILEGAKWPDGKDGALTPTHKKL